MIPLLHEPARRRATALRVALTCWTGAPSSANRRQVLHALDALLPHLGRTTPALVARWAEDAGRRTPADWAQAVLADAVALASTCGLGHADIAAIVNRELVSRAELPHRSQALVRLYLSAEAASVALGVREDGAELAPPLAAPGEAAAKEAS